MHIPSHLATCLLLPMSLLIFTGSVVACGGAEQSIVADCSARWASKGKVAVNRDETWEPAEDEERGLLNNPGDCKKTSQKRIGLLGSGRRGGAGNAECVGNLFSIFGLSAWCYLLGCTTTNPQKAGSWNTRSRQEKFFVIEGYAP